MGLTDAARGRLGVRGEIVDRSSVAEIARVAERAARGLGFSDERAGEVRLVATELSTNVLAHAGGGDVLVHATPGAEAAVEVLALDRGPGIPDVARALRDGFTTAGTRGEGLGAVVRAANRVDVFASPGRGTAVLARLAAGRDGDRRERVGHLALPYPGEVESGDAYAVVARPGALRVVVVDGLGHGTLAAEASASILDAIVSATEADPVRALEIAHEAGRGTRGAAVGIADVCGTEVTYAGVGNIRAVLVDGERQRSLASLSGTVGLSIPGRLTAFSGTLPKGGLAILHSDGITARWSAESMAGLTGRDPSLVCGVLWRDHARGTDDVTALVVRGTGPLVPTERP